MDPTIETEYISVGANRFSSVSSADPRTGVVAFGAGRVVALWDPKDPTNRLIRQTLPGHQSQITTLKHLPLDLKQPRSQSTDQGQPLLSGDDQGNLIFWLPSSTSPSSASSSSSQYHDRFSYTPGWSNQAHTGSISALGLYSFSENEGLFVSGGNDTFVNVFSWKIQGEGERTVKVEKVQKIEMGGRMPLDMVLGELPGGQGIILATSQTDRKIRLFTSPYPNSSVSSKFTMKVALEGHEDWIRCLDFGRFARLEGGQAQEAGNGGMEEDLVLASGGQDNYIRLWRITQLPPSAPESSASPHSEENKIQGEAGEGKDLDDDLLDEFERKITGETGRQLSTKAHLISVGEEKEGQTQFGVSLEALLIGHESKLTNLHFSPPHLYPSPRLLSSAADNSMIIWTPQTQGLGGQDVWLPDQRFGELGAGRSLGMFGAIWAVPIGKEEEVSVITNSWSGGLQRWRREHNVAGEEDWIADLAPTGHALPVKDLAWDPSGSFLVSVSADQTSRIHAPCQSAVQKSDSQPPVWGELGRPQVHGYDMTCVDFLGRLRFASGADEKVIRVFDAPKGFAGSLFALGVTEDDLTESARAVGASVPPLGLSNRALEEAVEDPQLEEKGFNQEHISISDEMSRLPNEAVLASATLWPEIEKLYGHGYELMAVAASPDGRLLATSCKATTPEHAVIRVYDTTTWKQVGKPLPGHSLTIARIRFSNNGQYVLSTSRDRTWRLFKRTEGTDEFEPVAADRPHARIIWDCAWASDDSYFATVSRDKQVKIWAPSSEGDSKWSEVANLKLKDSITAIDIVRDAERQRDLMALGFEGGNVELFTLGQPGLKMASLAKLTPSQSHVEQVSRLAWRKNGTQARGFELASCSEDRSTRITRINVSS